MIYRFSMRAGLNSPNILWDSIVPRSTVTASNETPAGNAVNLKSPATNNAWQCPDASGYVSFLLAQPEAVDTVGFASHSLSGRLVVIEAYNGATWDEIASVTPSDNAPFMIEFDGRTAYEWRISVSGGSFYIGVLFMGSSLVVPGVIQPPHTPLNLCEEVEIVSESQSMSGQFLGRDVAIYGGRASLSFEVQRPDFVMNGFDPFRRHFNRGNPFFFASCPKAYPNDMGYCWRDGGEIVPPFRDAVFMDISMDVRVYRG